MTPCGSTTAAEGEPSSSTHPTRRSISSGAVRSPPLDGSGRGAPTTVLGETEGVGTTRTTCRRGAVSGRTSRGDRTSSSALWDGDAETVEADAGSDAAPFPAAKASSRNGRTNGSCDASTVGVGASPSLTKRPGVRFGRRLGRRKRNAPPMSMANPPPTSIGRSSVFGSWKSMSPHAAIATRILSNNSALASQLATAALPGSGEPAGQGRATPARDDRPSATGRRRADYVRASGQPANDAAAGGQGRQGRA